MSSVTNAAAELNPQENPAIPHSDRSKRRRESRKGPDLSVEPFSFSPGRSPRTGNRARPSRRFPGEASFASAHHHELRGVGGIGDSGQATRRLPSDALFPSDLGNPIASESCRSSPSATHSVSRRGTGCHPPFQSWYSSSARSEPADGGASARSERARAACSRTRFSSGNLLRIDGLLSHWDLGRGSSISNEADFPTLEIRRFLHRKYSMIPNTNSAERAKTGSRRRGSPRWFRRRGRVFSGAKRRADRSSGQGRAPHPPRPPSSIDPG